jgi:hypothetical protein
MPHSLSHRPKHGGLSICCLHHRLNYSPFSSFPADEFKEMHESDKNQTTDQDDSIIDLPQLKQRISLACSPLHLHSRNPKNPRR